MTKSLRIYLAIAALVLCISVSILNAYNSSFPSHVNVHNPSQYCLNFLDDGSCDTPASKDKVTDFKPLNTNVVTVTAVMAALFLITLALLTVGDRGLGRDSVVILVALGILLFGVGIGGFIVYGNKYRKGKEVIIARLTSDQQACLNQLVQNRNTQFNFNNFLSTGNDGTPACSNFTFGEITYIQSYEQ